MADSVGGGCGGCNPPLIFKKNSGHPRGHCCVFVYTGDVYVIMQITSVRFALGAYTFIVSSLTLDSNDVFVPLYRDSARDERCLFYNYICRP